MKSILLLSFLSLSMFACTVEEDDGGTSSCDAKVVVSPTDYKNAPADPVTIESVTQSGNCVTIVYSSSGCSGDTWEVKLIDSGTVLDSDPPQRSLRLSLQNDEECDMVIKKEMSFDLSSLHEGGNAVVLSLANYSKGRFTYEY